MSPHPKHAFFNSALRRAKARLSEILTQEVSLVDKAANLRQFVIVKRNNMSEKTTKVALRLPTEAKQGIMDGLAGALDKLTALATMVGEAEADDAASVPDDLGMALKECASTIGGLADQYAAAPPAADPVADAPAPDAVAEPPAMSPDGKALPSPQTTPLNMSPEKDPLTMQPKTAAAIGELYKAIGSELTETAKAGRKIAGSRYKKLSELHDTLGKLLNELAFDDASEAAMPKGKDAPAAKVAKSDSDARIDELLSLARANQEKLAAHDVAIAKMAQVTDAPRAREREGAPPPRGVTWPQDMSAALAEKKKKAAR